MYSICKSIDIVYHVKERKEKDYMSISLDSKNIFTSFNIY